jgi:integrase
MAKKAKVPSPSIYWRLGNKVLGSWTDGARAYGDFRAYSDVGGGREALPDNGGTWGTTDPEIAEIQFARRLTELQEKRRGRAGVAQEKTTSLGKLGSLHLVKKKEAGTTSDGHLSDLEHRLAVAVSFFGSDRDPRTITTEDVRAWDADLGKGGKRGPGTRRHYLNALSGAYTRAQELGFVQPGYNPVALIPAGEKPTGRRRTEASFFEVHEAALILEAARVTEERERIPLGGEGHRVNATPALHAIIATFLLTGGRSSEVLGLDVQDLSFDRGLIYFRPNDHRGLKTSTSVRAVPLWPQLREILQAHLFAGDSPRTAGLLFPGRNGAMAGDLRKSLDTIGGLCGYEPGEVRTRQFRHTYCSARLQTVQRILKPGRDPSDPNAWEYVEVSRFTVQKEMGHGGSQLVDRIYGHAQRTPHRADVVEYRVEAHKEALGDRLRSLEAVGS